MKKLMFAAAVAAAGLAFGIESANTVGYTTKTIDAGNYMMIGVQFDTTAGTVMKAAEAFQLDKAPQAWASPDDEECISGWYVNAPCLKIPKGTVDKLYTDLYYASDAYDMDDGQFYKDWATEDGIRVKNVSLRAGYGVWIKAGNEDLTVTISGQVKASASDTFSGEAGYNLMRLPYPVALNAADSKINWGLSTQAIQAWASPDDEECISGWFANAPCIKIPKGTVDKLYTDLYYAKDAYDLDDGNFYEGWATEDGIRVKDAVIPVGMGFWLVATDNFTATQTK
jgi:hypothetical protein